MSVNSLNFKAPVRNASENVVCCIYLLTILTYLSLEANSVFTVKKASKNQTTKQTKFVVIGTLRVNSGWQQIAVTDNNINIFCSLL